jgi:hypothetical protein
MDEVQKPSNSWMSVSLFLTKLGSNPARWQNAWALPVETVPLQWCGVTTLDGMSPKLPINSHNSSSRLHVISEVLTAEPIFGIITPCSPLKVSRRFGRTYLLHLYGRRINRERNQLFILIPFRFAVWVLYIIREHKGNSQQPPTLVTIL